MSRRFVYYGAGVAGGFDPDAQAYFDVNSSIVLEADKNAINDFFVGLKDDGVYNKIYAMYLPIWSNAANNKWNLIDPRDLDAAFRLSFFGGITHDSFGFKGNGTNGYANTHINYLNEGYDVANYHASMYINNDSNVGIDYGADVSPGTTQFYFTSKTSLVSDRSVFRTESGLSVLDPNSLGYYIGNRQSLNVKQVWKNNSIIASSTNTAGESFQNFEATLGALNRDGTPSFYSGKRFAFFTAGEGLSNTESNNLYSRVSTLMTYFGINI